MTGIELPIAVIGAGGLGRQVLDIVRDQRRDILGVFDDSPSERDLALLEEQNVEYLGPTKTLSTAYDPQSIEYVIGIGTGRFRKHISDTLRPVGFTAAVLIHSAASIGYGVRLSQGVIIFAGARLETNTSIGMHTHINKNATIGHDCELANFVTVSPLAAVSGSVALEEGVTLGAGAFIIQGISIGKFSLVGAASAVLTNVPAETKVVGSPARALDK